jgi:hypothetical protein
MKTTRPDLGNAFLFACLTFPWLNCFVESPIFDFWQSLVAAVCGIFIALNWRRINASLLATSWLTAAMISSVMALLQYFGRAEQFAPLIFPTGLGEAYGNLRQRNHLATLTSFGLVALLAITAKRHGERPSSAVTAELPQEGREERQPVRPHLAWWMRGAALVLAMGNAASTSRTGLLEWVLVLGLALWWGRNTRTRIPRLAVESLALYGAAVLALPWLLNGSTGVESAGLMQRLGETQGSGRLVLWDNMLTLIGQKPWFGWGLGELSYAHFITDYPGARFMEDPLSNAHNLPLHLAVEWGVPFAAAVCLGAVWVLRFAKPWRETDPGRQMAWAVLATLALHSVLEYPLWYGHFQLALLLSLAWLWTSRPSRQGQTSGEMPASGLRRALPVAAGVTALIAVSAAAADYVRVSQLYLQEQDRLPYYRYDTTSKVTHSWFFNPSVQFSILQKSPLIPETAEAVYSIALNSMHYSAQPLTAEKLIASAIMTGRLDEARLYMDRYKKAYPERFKSWAQSNAQQLKDKLGYSLPG